MRPEVETLLELAGGAPHDRSQQDALLQLMLLLEIKNDLGEITPGNQTLREECLPDSLRSRPLEDEEEEKVVARLQRLVLEGDSEARRVGPIGVIRAAAAQLTIEPLLGMLVEHRKRFDSESVRQVLLGLEGASGLYSLPPEDLEKRHGSHVALVLRMIDPRAAVEELAADEDERVAEPARRLLPLIDPAGYYLAAGM